MMHKPSSNRFTDPVPKAGQQDIKSGGGKKSGNRKRSVLKDPPPKAVVPQTTTPKRAVDPRHPDPIPIQGDLKNGYSVSVSCFFLIHTHNPRQSMHLQIKWHLYCDIYFFSKVAYYTKGCTFYQPISHIKYFREIVCIDRVGCLSS